MPARHIYLLVPARHCACSAHLPRCLLGTAPPCEVLQDVRPTYGSLTGKKQGGTLGLNHMQNRAKKTCKLFHMSCKKTSCSTCHAKKQAVPHVMQKPCKTVQKTSCSTCCKNHAKTMQNGAYAPAPPNPHSPPRPCYTCYMCYMGLTRQATEHPLSPGCYMCYMCYMGLTRQATEHPLSPGSLLYVLYVLYGPI